MNKNIKYGVVAALTMAAFVAGPVGIASAVTTTDNYTAAEITALGEKTLVIGSKYEAAYTHPYDGKGVTADDVYIKYKDSKGKFAYLPVNKITVGGKSLSVKFYKLASNDINEKNQINEDVTPGTALDEAVDAGCYGVEVKNDGADFLSLGLKKNDDIAIRIDKAYVSGTSLTTTAQEKSALAYGIVKKASGYMIKIGNISLDPASLPTDSTVTVYNTATDRSAKANPVTDTTALPVGTYYITLNLKVNDNIGYKEGTVEGTGTDYDFYGTLSVSSVNIANYFEAKAKTTDEIVEFKEDGAEADFDFSPKAGITVPEDISEPAEKYNGDNEKTAGYKVTYTNNKAVGTATATITGMNNYTGSISFKFTVKAAEVGSIVQPEATYTGSPIEIKTIEDNNGNKYATGFTVNYAGAHTAVSDTGVEITVKGNTSSIITPADGIKSTLKIKKLDLGMATLKTKAEWSKLSDTDKAAAGTVVVISSKAFSTTAPSIEIYADGNKVSSSVYKVEFEAAKEAINSDNTNTANATATVKIAGTDSEISTGNVSTSVVTLQYVATKSLASATVSGVARAYTYNGNTKAPAITVKDGSTTLVEGTDYVVSYKDNLKVGTASVVITGIGDYSGTKTVKFYIDPAKSSVKKVSVGAKKMTVTVKKGSGASGVQIGYRVKGTSKWTYKKTTSTSATIKSLKKGKKYQIVVRSYTTKSGKVTNYSGWSATKTTAKIK